MRDAYPGNVIPPDDPLLSTVASRYSSLMVHPDRPGLSNNVAGNAAATGQTWALDARNLLLRLDHSFSPRFKATFSGYYNDRPAIRGCGGNQGCTVPNDPLSDSASNTEYIGQGFTQHIYTTHAHTQWDWIINNNLMSHSTVAWDRWYMDGASLSAGANWPERMWGSQQQSGLVLGDAGPPQINFAGNIPYNTLGLSWPAFGYEKNDRWQFSTDLAWVRGRSTIKVGFEYRHHTFRHKGWLAPLERPATSTSTGSRPAATTPPATTSARPVIPSPPSCSGRSTSPFSPSTPSPPGTRATCRRGSTWSSRSTRSSQSPPGCAWTTRPPAPSRTTSTRRSIRRHPTRAPATSPGP